MSYGTETPAKDDSRRSEWQSLLLIASAIVDMPVALVSIGEVDSHGCWALPVARITYSLTSLKASKMPRPRRLIVCASALV